MFGTTSPKWCTVAILGGRLNEAMDCRKAFRYPGCNRESTRNEIRNPKCEVRVACCVLRVAGLWPGPAIRTTKHATRSTHLGLRTPVNTSTDGTRWPLHSFQPLIPAGPGAGVHHPGDVRRPDCRGPGVLEKMPRPAGADTRRAQGAGDHLLHPRAGDGRLAAGP